MTTETITMDAAEFDAAMRRAGCADGVAAALYVAADGRTVLARGDDGVLRPVGEVVGTTPEGLVVEMTPTLASIEGTVVQR